MLRNIFLILLLSFQFYSGSSQDGIFFADKKIRYELSGGFGLSSFHYDKRNLNKRINGKSYHFETLNFKIGFSAEKPISRRWSLQSGLRLGLRLKRESIYSDPKLGNLVYPYSFFHQNDLVSKSSPIFIEIPLGILYQMKNSKVGLEVLHRSFTMNADNEGVDWGIMPNFSYNLGARLALRGEYFIGKYKNSRDYIHDDFGNIIYFDFNTRYSMIMLTYKLK